MKPDAFDSPCDPKVDKDIRNLVTKIVVWSTMGITILVAVFVLYISTCKGKESDYSIITQTLIPLWATWMGTVIAFYFGKSNFDSATKSYNRIIDKLSPEDRLASVPVVEVMVPIAEMSHLDYDSSKLKTLKEILSMEEFSKYNRYAILDNNRLKYVIHKSEFTKYLADSLIQGNERSCDDTLEMFIENGVKDPSTIWLTGAGFASVASTLLDVKKVMNSLQNVQDVFITRTGKSNEPIIGLVTNNIVMDNLEL